MIIDKAVLDALSAQAKASPQLRMNLDLRNSPSDGSQRMLNALEAGDGVAYPQTSCFIGNCRYNPWQDPMGVL